MCESAREESRAFSSIGTLAPARRAAVGKGEEDTNQQGEAGESQLTGCGAKSPTFYRANTPPPTWFSLGPLAAKQQQANSTRPS